MNKEFVTYEQAVALKELGFDEPCFGKYLSSLQSDWKVYELILEMGMNEEFEDNRNVYLLEGACSAPLYQQAFRWFRENGIDYSIVPMRVDGWNEYQYVIFTLDEIVETSFNNYEEAEQACLDKLIEIVKNK